MLSCGATCRTILHDAMPLLKELRIDKPQQMNLKVASRFRDITTIYINSLLKVTVDEDEGDGWTEINLDLESKLRVVHFLSKFDNLDKVVFVGKDENGDDIQYFTTIDAYFFEGEDQSYPDEGGRQSMLSFIDLLSGGYNCGVLSKPFKISGLVCPDATNRQGMRSDSCKTCLRACRSFPLESVAEFECRGSSKSKWTTDSERHQLPKYNDESWLELYRELEVLRSPLIFQLFGSNIKHLYFKKDVEIISATNSTAICNQIMRLGEHSVTLRFSGDIRGLNVGIIRPKYSDWDNIQIREPRDHSCSEVVYTIMSLGSGVRYSFYERHGTATTPYCPEFDDNYQRPVGGHPFYIGMTLDLDAGTLIVFKNGQRVGLMKAGLSGEYCWFVKGEASSSQGRVMVSIDRGTSRKPRC